MAEKYITIGFDEEGKPVKLPKAPTFSPDSVIPQTVDEPTLEMQPAMNLGPEMTQQIPALAPEEAVIVPDDTPEEPEEAELVPEDEEETIVPKADEEPDVFAGVMDERLPGSPLEEVSPSKRITSPNNPLVIPSPMDAPLRPGELDLDIPRTPKLRPQRMPKPEQKGVLASLKNLFGGKKK